MMKSTWKCRIALAGAASALLVVLVGAAIAAAPTKNGLYAGTITGKGLTKHVELHVSANGRRATASLSCEGSLVKSLKSFPITRAGRFNGHDKRNNFGVKGRFTSATAAAARLHMYGICDVAAPVNYVLTLSMSPTQ
jgi:hypothetical protein